MVVTVAVQVTRLIAYTSIFVIQTKAETIFLTVASFTSVSGQAVIDTVVSSDGGAGNEGDSEESVHSV